MKTKSAIKKINQNGILLVFPINNRPEPNSVWAELHPNKKMVWKWSDSGSNQVAEMWHLMKHLSDCGEVVYSKWYQGRATFFSKQLFTAMLCKIRELNQAFDHTTGLSFQARELFEILEGDSPLSTKELKKLAGLKGRDNEGTYSKVLKSLFNRLLIVAYGEVDDGAFPSLAVGATQLLFEDLWNSAREMKPTAAAKIIDQNMPVGSLVRKYFDKNLLVITKES